MPHEHDWGPWHWFVTAAGWARVCLACGAWEPPYDQDPLKVRPTEGEVCGVCAPSEPCGER